MRYTRYPWSASAESYGRVRCAGPSERLQSRVVDKYVKLLQADDNPAVTRGFTLAIGALPKKLLIGSIEPVITALADHCVATRCVDYSPSRPLSVSNNAACSFH